ncbi:helix-turn-helix domain-containing protein [Celeribacter indicus]|uniref:Transcriptional regulator n=1 Tax=Celeribacter indicus TaxID=1208324 RepID=A0A0B5DYH0_9RHOB|nr:helix-turn-helix domain-containing protein [Celeribacter indicus]AJE48054.1 transcriptional regulator [Celeribacter indicus]SDW31037.1 transcriptional regulator, AraC family [Celeribacter indicus]
MFTNASRDLSAPSAPARLRESHFDCFLDQEAALDGWDQIYRQLAPGAFSGHVTTLDWGEISLSRETVNLCVENAFRLPETHLCFGFSVGRPVKLAQVSDRMARGVGTLHVPEENYHVITRGDADYVLLTVPRAMLPDRFGAAARLIRGTEAQAIADWMLALLESARTGLASDSLLALAPDLLLDRITLWAQSDSRGMVPFRHRRGLLNDLLAACDGLTAETLSVGHLARLLGRDRATLRTICLEETGMRLDDVLKGRRLSEVYRRLRLAGPEDTRVSDVSMEFGYLHWGRFAQSYRAMFGERPSDTLRRPRPC